MRKDAGSLKVIEIAAAEDEEMEGLMILTMSPTLLATFKVHAVRTVLYGNVHPPLLQQDDSLLRR